MRPARMKNSTRAAIVLLVAVVVVVAAYAAFVLPTPPVKIVPVVVSIPHGVGSNSDLNFSPQTIKVVIGVNNTVVWMNRDTTNHTVTAFLAPQGASKFSSGNIMPGQNFTVTFTVPGAYAYECTLHLGWMQGAVIVKSA